MSKTAGAPGLEYFIMRLRKLTTGSPLLRGSHLAGPVIFLILAGTPDYSACGNSATEARSVTPWKRQYKIKPSEKARMTVADVLGPDGIVYPNWTKCGVQGGIPKTKAFASIEDFGAKADDNADDSEALAKACEAAGKAGGGAVLFGEGTYYLDRPVTVRHDNVVVRGRGPDKTRLIFRYSKPTGLMKMTMMVDDIVIGRWSRSKHSGNTFAFSTYGRNAIGKLPNGRHVLKGIAEYRDGSKRTGEIPIVLDSAFDDTRLVADSRAAITFAGKGTVDRKLKLARDGKRGDMKLKLKSTKPLRIGDCIIIEGPATDRWKKLTKNACEWGTYRVYEVIISDIKDNTISIDQPLRIEFPVIDGSFVQKVVPIQRCGIESLYLEQTENLWISGVVFYHGWNCWARDVTVKKCG
ncbi:MAG: glycosyl hydrolase family 28-related protein, partial [Planctomycetota bacterium]